MEKKARRARCEAALSRLRQKVTGRPAGEAITALRGWNVGGSASNKGPSPRKIVPRLSAFDPLSKGYPLRALMATEDAARSGESAAPYIIQQSFLKPYLRLFLSSRVGRSLAASILSHGSMAFTLAAHPPYYQPRTESPVSQISRFSGNLEVLRGSLRNYIISLLALLITQFNSCFTFA